MIIVERVSNAQPASTQLQYFQLQLHWRDLMSFVSVKVILSLSRL